MDFAETRKWLEKTMQQRGTDSVTFGDLEVFKDMITGKMMIQQGQEKFDMGGMLPAEIFDRLSAAISMYRNLGTDDPESDRTPEEQAAYDLLSM